MSEKFINRDAAADLLQRHRLALEEAEAALAQPERLHLADRPDIEESRVDILAAIERITQTLYPEQESEAA